MEKGSEVSQRPLGKQNFGPGRPSLGELLLLDPCKCSVGGQCGTLPQIPRPEKAEKKKR